MTSFSIKRFAATWPALAILALPLAACGGGGNDENDQRTASGEVLEGTISDAMIPLDTVTSQPPLMKSEPAQPASGAADQPSDDEGEPEVEATATPAPTETPAPTAQQTGVSR